MGNENLKKAIEIINGTQNVFAAVKGESTITSDLKGIGFLARLCNQNENLCGYSAADKIVGKAAALLFVKLGIKCVYAQTISKGALEVFERYGTEYGYAEKADTIMNRENTGMCPMENAVKDCNEPDEALKAINETLERLRNKRF